LPDGDRLTTVTIVALLHDFTTEMTHSSVPNKHKENVYCLVDNSENIAHHEQLAVGVHTTTIAVLGTAAVDD